MEGYIQKLGGVKRYVQFLEISDNPELVAQYCKWHSEESSWKEVRDGIRAVGMTADYNPSLLARSIKKYFERNDEALEVLIFKGKKSISVSRDLTLSPDYYRIFMRRYVK